MDREARQNESEVQKKEEARLEVRIIIYIMKSTKATVNETHVSAPLELPKE